MPHVSVWTRGFNDDVNMSLDDEHDRDLAVTVIRLT